MTCVWCSNEQAIRGAYLPPTQQVYLPPGQGAADLDSVGAGALSNREEEQGNTILLAAISYWAGNRSVQRRGVAGLVPLLEEFWHIFMCRVGLRARILQRHSCVRPQHHALLLLLLQFRAAEQQQYTQQQSNNLRPSHIDVSTSRAGAKAALLCIRLVRRGCCFVHPHVLLIEAI